MAEDLSCALYQNMISPLNTILFSMNDFDTLNKIVETHDIKLKVLAVYGLDELVKQGENYVTPAMVPNEIGLMPEIIYEDNDPSFCSVFSDSFEFTFQSTNMSLQSNDKLQSQGTILSSEFEHEKRETILTSDETRG